jgi:hypothetical protein
MDWFVIVFRILHIVSAVVWAGGAALFFFYIEPSITTLGADAEKFTNELLTVRKMPIYFAMASTFTVIGGVILYVRDAGGVRLWLDAPMGVGLTVGALAAIVAWIGGNLFIPRTALQLQAVLGEMRSAGGPPSGEILGRLKAGQERLRMIGMIDLILIAIAVLAMSTARYLR